MAITLVVETGVGLANANSYASLEDSEAYFADRGDTVWAAADDEDKKAALIRATQAVDDMGNGRFLGTKMLSTQALAWPRDDAYDQDGFQLVDVPVHVFVATCEGAILELGTPGVLTPAYGRGGAVIEERVEGAVTVKYSEGAAAGTVYTSVTRALRPVLRGYGAMYVTRA
jgi:hypothetical protein